MAEEIDFENGRISNSEGLVTITLDNVLWHTVPQHSSICNYVPNFIRCGIIFVDVPALLLGRLLVDLNYI